MYNRELGKTILGLDSLLKTVFTCSTGDYASGADINGSIIDRAGLSSTQSGAATGVLGKNDRFLTAEPFLLGVQQAGSTAANRAVTVDVRLQHGDSSGGGDMADLTAPANLASAVFLNTALTTDMQNWTSAPVKVYSNPVSYEIGAAKRYIRAVGKVTKAGLSTSTAAADTMNVMLGIRFGEPTASPPANVTTSSSTST